MIVLQMGEPGGGVPSDLKPKLKEGVDLKVCENLKFPAPQYRSFSAIESLLFPYGTCGQTFCFFKAHEKLERGWSNWRVEGGEGSHTHFTPPHPMGSRMQAHNLICFQRLKHVPGKIHDYLK